MQKFPVGAVNIVGENAVGRIIYGKVQIWATSHFQKLSLSIYHTQMLELLELDIYEGNLKSALNNNTKGRFCTDGSTPFN